MNTLVIANQKGGVGKTTTAVNLSASLFAMKRKVLLVDLDPQANATTGSGIKKTQQTEGLVLPSWEEDRTQIKASKTGGYDVLPSGPILIAKEAELRVIEERELQLDRLLRQLENKYDYIIIDCPPALNLLTINGLRAASYLLVPMQCEYYALEGLAALLQTVDQLNERTGHTLELGAIVRTMFDPRNKLTKLITEDLITHFPRVLFSTVIPRNVRLAEAPSFGKPALNYEPNAKGTLAYLALAGELIERIEEQEGQEDLRGVATHE